MHSIILFMRRITVTISCVIAVNRASRRCVCVCMGSVGNVMKTTKKWDCGRQPQFHSIFVGSIGNGGDQRRPTAHLMRLTRITHGPDKHSMEGVGDCGQTEKEQKWDQSKSHMMRMINLIYFTFVLRFLFAASPENEWIVYGRVEYWAKDKHTKHETGVERKEEKSEIATGLM